MHASLKTYLHTGQPWPVAAGWFTAGMIAGVLLAAGVLSSKKCGAAFQPPKEGGKTAVSAPAGLETDEEDLLKGQDLYSQGEWQKAATFLRRAARREGASRQIRGESLFYLGKINYLQGNYPEAREKVADAADSLPEHHGIRLWQARTALALDNPDTARQHLIKTLHTHPKDAQVLHLLSQCSAAVQDLPQTAAWLEMAAAAAEELAVIFLDQARLYHQLGFKDQTDQALIQAEGLMGPEHPLRSPVQNLRQSRLLTEGTP